MAKGGKTVAAPAADGEPEIIQFLRKPAVRRFLSQETAKSDVDLRLGPGGTWGFGNEEKRVDITDLNNFLHALLQRIAGE